MPRRSKYTPDVVKRLCDAIAIGATYDLACKYAGISDELFRRWRATKVGFLGQVQAAEARGAIGWLAKIEQAASAGSWQAAAWKLERRYPADYGRTVQQVEHSGTVVQEHTGALEVHAVDYRDAIRALAPPPDDREAAG